MNSLQTELNKINEQLELLTFRKNQLEPIIAEYNDVISRVQNLVEKMIDVNVEPLNLKLDVEDIINGDFDPKPFSVPTQPEPIQQDWADEWVQTSLEAHNEDGEVEAVEVSNHSVINSYIIPFDPAVHGDPVEDEQPATEETEPETTPQPELTAPCSFPVKVFAIVPVLTPSPTPEPQPEPEINQINMSAYRKGNDHLLIGFNNKRLLTTWSKWFKSNWGDTVNLSEYSNSLEGFSYTLTVLWFGHPNWERLTGLNYSLKPTEQNKKV